MFRNWRIGLQNIGTMFWMLVFKLKIGLCLQEVKVKQQELDFGKEKKPYYLC